MEAGSKIIIAIDGYSSCGKSTMARQLASRLAYTFIDSGAMYRAITLYLLRREVPLADVPAVEQALEQIRLNFQWDPGRKTALIQLNGELVEEHIRQMEVAASVSKVAAIAAVRRFAVARQQAMGREKGIVMDGRDIGTVVFPDAELKIFVTADPEVRVQRRFKELTGQHIAVSVEEVRRNLQERDLIDTTRAESPLRQAADAYLLDNSHMTPEEQLELVLELAEQRILTKL